MDNTSEDNANVQAPEIRDQETLERALNAEPVEEGEVAEEVDTDVEGSEEESSEDSEPIMGKYKDISELEKAHKALQAEFTKRNEALKELQEKARKAERENLKSLDYDEQVAYLVDELNRVQDELEAQKKTHEEITAESMIESDRQALESFIKKTPALVETGMDDIFRELAASEKYQQYTFASIYNSLMKPKIESLMGTKVRTKTKTIKKTQSKPDVAYENVEQLGKQDYEANREQILREAGIRI